MPYLGAPPRDPLPPSQGGLRQTAMLMATGFGVYAGIPPLQGGVGQYIWQTSRLFSFEVLVRRARVVGLSFGEGLDRPLILMPFGGSGISAKLLETKKTAFLNSSGPEGVRFGIL
ncbi:hypothetical protein VTL71DRAFT_12022 [Oculimacula yallundae]|uniref:Uncharacterized protein n=1 Tax=Oculimacula yallundae TaxID=86028 RepID=A0ABR4CUC4_9HELO